jgi:hypothetical protein
MDWDISWEKKNGDSETILGTTRVSANKVMDALDKFFREKDNCTKKMTGIRVVPEEPNKPKRRKVLDK